MAVEHVYDVTVTWQHDRKGIMRSSVLNKPVEVATPPEFAKGMAGIWSPEHLLVAAVNSCLMTTFLAIADNFNLNFISFDSHGAGKLSMVDGKYMISEITLTPEVVIAREEDREKAEKVLYKSEANCLISHSIKSMIIFTPVIKVLNEAPQAIAE